jgi:hypothetical protein
MRTLMTDKLYYTEHFQDGEELEIVLNWVGVCKAEFYDMLGYLLRQPQVRDILKLEETAKAVTGEGIDQGRLLSIYKDSLAFVKQIHTRVT